MKEPALALVLLLAVTSGSGGQEKRPLTLEQAQALAIEHNPVYRQAQNAVVSARAGELVSRSAFFPTLNASFSSGANLRRTLTGVDDFEQPVRLDEALEFSSSSSSQGLSLNWELFDGGQRYREVRAARAGREAAVAGVEQSAATLHAELSRRYYEAQRAAATIELEEELLRLAESRHAATERLLRVAAASPVDLLGTEFEVSRQRQAVESARAASRVAMLNLVEQMGIGGSEEWELLTEAPEVFDPQRFDADELVTRAHALSPRLREIAAEVRQANESRRAAAAVRWPSISANANVGRSLGSQGYGALFEPNPLNQSFSFGIGVSLPLFSQYQTTQQITQARVQAMNAEERARATRLLLEREVRTAYIELENAYRTVVLNNASTELARRRLELANERYRLGAITFAEMQTIIESASSAERDALNARYDFAIAVATLEERVGGSLDGEGEGGRG